jgi:putative heme-binding domain-containing protein
MSLYMSTLRKSFTTALACAGASIVVVTGVARGAAEPAGQAAPQVNRDEILAAQVKDEKGGAADAGRPLFEERCAACHRFGGIGKDVGPDLTTITSRFKKKDILESILWPSKVISDQYQAEMFELTDGKIVSGLIVRESAAAILVRTADAPEKPVAVPKAQIASRAPSTVSLMPEGLVDTLTPKQIADLLAFTMAPPPDK